MVRLSQIVVRDKRYAAAYDVALKHENKQSNVLRAPAVPRGTAVIVTRYRADVAKVALVNPEDLAMLEPYLPLCTQLGRLSMSLADHPSVDRIEVSYRGHQIGRAHV